MYKYNLGLTYILTLPLFTISIITSNDFLFNGGFDFIDLSNDMDEKADFSNFFEFVLRNKTDDYVSEMDVWNYFGNYEHVGTHIDASPSSRTTAYAGDIPLQRLILPLIIVDVSPIVHDNKNFVLYKYHLDYMLNNYFGRTWQPCLIVFKFGWSKFFYDLNKYFGISEENDGLPSYPGLSEEVAEWITTSYKNVVGVGVDVPTVDPAASAHYPARRTLLDAGLYLLENVKLDKYVPEAACTALVMSPKYKHRRVGAVRLTAICPKEHLRTTWRPSNIHF